MGRGPLWSIVLFTDNHTRSYLSSKFFDWPPSETVVCVMNNHHRSYQWLAFLTSMHFAQLFVSSIIIRDKINCLGLWINIQYDHLFVSSIKSLDHVIHLLFCRSNMISFFCFINNQPWSYRTSCFIGTHPSWASICCNDQYPWWYHSTVFESIHPLWLAVCFIDNLPWSSLSNGFRGVHATWSVACLFDNHQWSYHSIGHSLKHLSWSVVGFIVSQPWIQPSFGFLGILAS